MDKFVVLSMTSESKEIAKVLSNETAIKILNKLAEKRMCASELANELKMPISTIQYNLDLLKGVNLIQDTAYRYSEKGKKVLYYEPAKKTIILAPEKEKESILNMLKNKLLIPIVLGISAAIGFISQSLFGGISGGSASFETAPLAESKTAGTIIAYEAPKIAFYQQPWFIFFLGALFATIAFLIAYLSLKKFK